MPDLNILELKVLKTIFIFELSTLKFVKYESLTHTVNFGIRSAFSKGPGSAFPKGPENPLFEFIKHAPQISPTNANFTSKRYY